MITAQLRRGYAPELSDRIPLLKSPDAALLWVDVSGWPNAVFLSGPCSSLAVPGIGLGSVLLSSDAVGDNGTSR